jgi:hypothetical protein
MTETGCSKDGHFHNLHVDNKVVFTKAVIVNTEGMIIDPSVKAALAGEQVAGEAQGGKYVMLNEHNGITGLGNVSVTGTLGVTGTTLLHDSANIGGELKVGGSNAYDGGVGSTTFHVDGSNGDFWTIGTGHIHKTLTLSRVGLGLSVTNDATVGGTLGVTGNLITKNGLNIGQSVTQLSTGTDRLLAAADSGTIFVTAALGPGAKIKLPPAASAVGSYFRIVICASPTTTAEISLPDGGTGVFIGAIVLIAKHGNANQYAVATQNQGQNGQRIKLEPKKCTAGGDIGSVYEIYYKSPTQVFVYGNIYHTESAASQNSGIFDTQGYSS